MVYTFCPEHPQDRQGRYRGAKKNLEGVTFDLYKKVDTEEPDIEGKYPFCGGKYIAISDAEAKNLGLTDNENEKWIMVKTLTTRLTARIPQRGLPSGTYKLVETKTVNGYNLLSKPRGCQTEPYLCCWMDNHDNV